MTAVAACLITFGLGFLLAAACLDEFYRKKYEAKMVTLINEMVKIWYRLDHQNKAKAKQSLH